MGAFSPLCDWHAMMICWVSSICRKQEVKDWIPWSAALTSRGTSMEMT